MSTATLPLAAALDALADMPASRKGPPCSVTLILDKLDKDAPELRERIVGLIDDQSVRIAPLVEVLLQHGYDIGRGAMTRHRNRGMANGCKCPR